MISFFSRHHEIFAVSSSHPLGLSEEEKLAWLFGNAKILDQESIPGPFVGPRASMITPWSTNAVEITQNMGIVGIDRIERFIPFEGLFDTMISEIYKSLHQKMFELKVEPENIKDIIDIADYNEKEGLALSEEEIDYLDQLSTKMGRYLTDSEVFGFSQVNSEHCRHKIFNGQFIIDGNAMPSSLFKLIKKTTKTHPNFVISAYKDNVAFIDGPPAVQFAPDQPDKPSLYRKSVFESILSLKAETHNFPTTVEPFNGAATGSGGEIRDRLAGGRGAIPLAGTALYMTAYPRLEDNRPWVEKSPPRDWLYQSPLDILIKASNGASDFGNKFGQPLICGSVLTFEHLLHGESLGYDKVIMLAGGVGYGKKEMADKSEPVKGDRIVVLGGDNYRIGMGGAAVSSADTGEFSKGIELNAVQRSNPEMQKRAANTIRALVESDGNPIVSIHDHGAGGHLNCLSELVESCGGKIDLDKLPVGDPTLSDRELIGNESQERMGLIVGENDMALVRAVAERERCPMYEVGLVTGDGQFTFESFSTGRRPMDLKLSDMFGSSPKTVMSDQTLTRSFGAVQADRDQLISYLRNVLRLESVACKDWLTNKVDRCVGGLVAKQQCTGPLQLPLNNVGVMAIDYEGQDGVATSMGHAPLAGLINPAAGSRLSVSEALMNIVWAPLVQGLSSVSLSANWMWPCKNKGEDVRLYEAVKAISDFALQLGINIPTGKDSLSMKQKYPDREVLAPGTVVVSAAAHCSDISSVVEPVLKDNGHPIYFVNITGGTFELGGSALAQTLNTIGNTCPDIADATILVNTFEAIQQLVKEDMLDSGHDISAGGLITCLLEMCFPSNNIGLDVDLRTFKSIDRLSLLFAENTGAIIQGQASRVENTLNAFGVNYHKIGVANSSGKLTLKFGINDTIEISVPEMRDCWYETSYLLDRHQTAGDLAKKRYNNYKKQPLIYSFPEGFDGALPKRQPETVKPVAAVLREKGSNSERELAHALYLAGFDVRDVHMTDLISGRENLEDVRFLGAVGGFSNSDVLGSAKGWAGAFLYNEKAKECLDRFFSRKDVLSIGICNGCQLFMELNLINPSHERKGFMDYNDSGKHESAFTSVKILKNHTVMLSSLAGTTLGVWVSNGEGKFVLPEGKENYHLVAEYGYVEYPADPNGSDFNLAMLASKDGRHLVTMPHIERSIFPWNWAYYQEGRSDAVSPWLQAFVNARKWIESNPIT